MVTGQASGKGVPLKSKLNVVSLFFEIKLFRGLKGPLSPGREKRAGKSAIYLYTIVQL